MPFIPSPDVLNKLVIKASQLMNEQYVLNYLNPKEKKRYGDEQNLEDPVHEPYCEIRVRPVKIEYLDLVDAN